MENEPVSNSLYPVLLKSDKELRDEIFAILSSRVKANPYGDESEFAVSIRSLPVGLRAMAATHYLDFSLAIDDIGWHFLNFGEPKFVKETELGLRELGLDDLAGWFVEAYEIIDPLKAEIRESDDYLETLLAHGCSDRIDELNRRARAKEDGFDKKAGWSAIYYAWVRYTRQHPERVFGNGLG